jgi:hypothetical protein
MECILKVYCVFYRVETDIYRSDNVMICAFKMKNDAESFIKDREGIWSIEEHEVY